MKHKDGLIGCFSTAMLMAGFSVALIRGCQESYDSGRPRVVYLVNGKPIITRTFKTNEELQDYMKSDQGKREATYYSSLNKKTKR